MAYRNQSQLSKIGAEGFALLDSGKRGKQQPLPRHEPKATATSWSLWPSQKVVQRRETVIDCNKAAQVYGGILVKEYVNIAPVRKVYYYPSSSK